MLEQVHFVAVGDKDFNILIHNENIQLQMKTIFYQGDSLGSVIGELWKFMQNSQKSMNKKEKIVFYIIFLTLSKYIDNIVIEQLQHKVWKPGN